MTDHERTNAMYRRRTEQYVRDVGSGPTVVFSHGTLMDRTMFDPQLDALSDEYRAIAYDSRARTDRWRGPYDLNDLADDCVSVMDALTVDRAVLVGMSMGGFMALRFALRHPERLAGLVLIDSKADAYTEAERAEYGAMVDQLEGVEDVPRELAELVTTTLFGETTRRERPEQVEHWLNRWLTYPSAAVKYEIESWLDAPDLTDRLAEIDVPVLVVHGEEDVAIDSTRAKSMLEHFPDGRFVGVPGAGHSSNTEQPDVVNEALRAFLDEIYD